MKASREEERPVYGATFSWCGVQVGDRLSGEWELEDEVTRLRGLIADIVRDDRLFCNPHLAARLEKKVILESPTD